MTKLVVFGEILFDLFEKEKKIGGAPLNFAAHSRKLGAAVSLVSALGEDDLGKEALLALEGFGLGKEGVAVLPGLPTGSCLVTLQKGVPSYHLVENTAYDAIPIPSGKEMLAADALYFGTLALRSFPSFETLQALLCQGNYREVFCDINIRQHYYTPALLHFCLSHCTVLKVSREEIEVFEKGSDPRNVCCALAAQYPNLRCVVVTLDKDGALSYDCEKREFWASPKPSSRPVSTVGAGDSFSAAFLCRYLEGYPMNECLSAAVILSDFVVTKLEAIPSYPEKLQAQIGAVLS